MEEILRNGYLEQLLSYRWNGQVKVITGIRRAENLIFCGGFSEIICSATACEKNR